MLKYQITVWNLGADDAVEAKWEVQIETEWQAIHAWDTITRGIRGHYQAWLVNLEEGKAIRASSVMQKD